LSAPIPRDQRPTLPSGRQHPLLARLWDKITDPVLGAVITALTALGGTVALGIYLFPQTILDKTITEVVKKELTNPASLISQTIIETVLRELKTPDSKLLGAIGADIISDKSTLFASLASAYKRTVQSEYGEMEIGYLKLTDTHPSGSMQVFVPPDQDGVLHFEVANLPPGWVIEILTRFGSGGWICEAGRGSHTFKKLLTRSGSAVIPGKPVEQSDWRYFDNIYLLTFRLQPLDTSDDCKQKQDTPMQKDIDPNIDPAVAIEKPQLPSYVSITYVAAVSPPFTSEELK
jgi:hypothetical protein